MVVMTAYDVPERLWFPGGGGPDLAAGEPDPLPGKAPGGSPAAPPAGAPQPPGLGIAIQGVSKHYGQRQVLQGVSLDIAPGEFVAIVGRSGCGKSTLLRLLAGLEAVDAGLLAIAGQPPAAQRADTRMMFQDARLLPWKRVLANVELGLASPRLPPLARAALAQVGLADRAHDWPAVLSGGQKQRVALARALAQAPRLLLLDEPLGALDALTRIEMQQLIEGLWREQGFTVVLVTHDVAEAVALADRVVLLEDGRVALDQRIPLPRPRSRGQAAFAAIEEALLQRVLHGALAPGA